MVGVWFIAPKLPGCYRFAPARILPPGEFQGARSGGRGQIRLRGLQTPCHAPEHRSAPETKPRMSKPAKSQWNFGELFPTPELRRVLTVAELTARVRALLEKQVGQIWVGGEITNLRAQSSGHIYFTLKDASSQLSCVLFSREAVEHRRLLADGQKVLLQGDVTVYEARGHYQLIVRAVELQGVGALQIALEKLKQKLAAEGLFAPERKRPLPRYPQRIGLVTSPTGAAIQDVLHVVQRRNPGLEILLVPCRVQGQGAAAEIAAAIRLLNAYHVQEIPARSIDLILLTRGGGSLEDLWAFNEEAVARAIFESALPVMSAIGHEIDFTISDFVADARAATPSAAGEILTEGVFSSHQQVVNLLQRMARTHPRRELNEQLQRLDDLRTALRRRAEQAVEGQRVAWENLAARLRQARPQARLILQHESLQASWRRMRERIRERIKDCQSRRANAESRLRLLGPEQVLARGYSITTVAATGEIIRQAQDVQPGQILKTRVKEGEIISTVKQKSAT